MTTAGEDTEVISDGRRLAASLFLPPSRPTCALLFVHGLNSDRTGYLQRASAATDELGAACLAFDLSGHGASHQDLGSLTPQQHLADLVAAYDRLLQAVPESSVPVGVCGASYGGYLAALLPAQRPVWRIVLRAPGMYTDDDLDVPLAVERRSRARVGDRLRDSAGAFSGDLLLVESEDDEVIPASVIQAYLELFPRSRREVLAGAGHVLVLPEERQAFLSLLLEWFDPRREPAPARASRGSTPP